MSDVALDDVEDAVDQSIRVDDGPEGDVDNPLMRYSRNVDRDGVRAFIRIPNIHQQERIRAKALADRTRMARLCRDESSDPYLAIEAKMEPLFDEDDDSLRRFLISQHMQECISQAAVFIQNADPEKYPQYAEFKNADEISRKLNLNLRSEEPDPEITLSCEAILHSYGLAVQDMTRELLEPYEVEYGVLERDGLIDKIRRVYAKAECDSAFLATYNDWTVFFGTRDAENINKSYWDTFDDMINESLEVTEVITDDFRQLEREAGGDVKKAQAATRSSRSSDSPESLVTGE